MASKSLSKVVLWQTISKFLIEGIAFFTAPIFTRLLTTTDYGLMSVYSTWVSFLSLFIGLQTYGSIPMAKVKYEDNNYEKYLSTIMLLSFFTFLVFLTISIIFSQFLSRILGIDNILIPVLVIQSFSSFCITFYLSKLIQNKDVEKNSILSLVLSISSVVLSLIFVIQANEKKYFYKIIGGFIPQFILGFILFILTLKKGKFSLKKEYIEFCLPITLPLIFHGAGALILNQSDRVMLQKMISANEVGVYSIAYSLSLIINIIWSSFNSSWVPFYYEYRKSGNEKDIKEKSNGYLFTFSILTMGFMLCAPEVFKIMAPEPYWGGLKYIPLFALGYYFNFLYSFPANFEFYSKNTKMIAVGTSISAVLNLGLNFLLIPKFAGYGAALATTISFFFLFLFHDLIARFYIREGRFHYSYLFYIKGLIPVLLVFALYYCTLELFYVRWILAVVLGVMLLIKVIKKKSIF